VSRGRVPSLRSRPLFCPDGRRPPPPWGTEAFAGSQSQKTKNKSKGEDRGEGRRFHQGVSARFLLCASHCAGLRGTPIPSKSQKPDASGPLSPLCQLFGRQGPAAGVEKAYLPFETAEASDPLPKSPLPSAGWWLPLGMRGSVCPGRVPACRMWVLNICFVGGRRGGREDMQERVLLCHPSSIWGKRRHRGGRAMERGMD
jgi:hypothetical protein